MTTRLSGDEVEVEVDGRRIELTHLDKVFWPGLGLTKADLINYYIEVAPYLLPHLKGRPFIMKPYPSGAGGRSFFRWEIPDYAPAWVHRWAYQAQTEQRVIEMVVVAGLPELVWLANQACIELHPWLSHAGDPLHPDQAVFDLDPGPGTGFVAVLDVASWLHSLLEELGVRAYAKTSGGKGMHVLVPLEPRYTFQEIRAWVHGVGLWLASEHGAHVTLGKALAARRGKVLVDYSQNALGKSVASAYSARATPDATVSTPLSWQEVGQRQVRPDDFTLLTAPGRLKDTGDLLKPMLKGQTLPELEAVRS